MEINDLDFYLVEIEHTESQRPVRSLLVRLETDFGLVGWGESAVGWRPAELVPRSDAMLATLAGRSIFDVEELHTLEVLADPALRCAVEMAYWDLLGRSVGQPLCRLFGGEYRRRIPLAVRLTATSGGPIGQVARELAEQGFHCQVVASSGRTSTDLQAVRRIRESVGDRTELRLDVAGCYDLETVRELCRELESEEIQFLVDPLDTDELHSVASLRRQTSVPLAVWRTIGSPADVLAAVRCSAAAFVVVDPRRVGGLVPARKCAAVADAAEIVALLTGGPSLGIGTAAVLQLAAATPNFSGCNECAYPQLADDVLAESLEIVDGMIAVPQAPGLGIEVDRAKVERYRVT